MSDEAFTLVGVAIGALATGAAQVYLSRKDRAVEARAAARALWASAFEARIQLEEIEKANAWGGYEGFQRYLPRFADARVDHPLTL